MLQLHDIIYVLIMPEKVDLRYKMYTVAKCVYFCLSLPASWPNGKPLGSSTLAHGHCCSSNSQQQPTGSYVQTNKQISAMHNSTDKNENHHKHDIATCDN